MRPWATTAMSTPAPRPLDPCAEHGSRLVGGKRTIPTPPPTVSPHQSTGRPERPTTWGSRHWPNSPDRIRIDPNPHAGSADRGIRARKGQWKQRLHGRAVAARPSGLMVAAWIWYSRRAQRALRPRRSSPLPASRCHARLCVLLVSPSFAPMHGTREVATDSCTPLPPHFYGPIVGY